ncbi:MAG: flagellar hook-length control protein FliK [Lachnospiraceae bacterium]|nr:flagellar hook-length control protein FliK [Lachnospiraceae bacterium]
MALIPSIFSQFTPTDINQNQTTAADASVAASDATKQAVLEMIDNLSVGDTILGKVTAQTDKSISILTQGGVTINAQNSSSVNFEKGSLILFEIQKVSGRDVSIRPLYQNTNLQNTAQSALKQAGLPINERSLEMTARNMEYGNPIDRNSLIEAYRDVALFPEASVKSIVDLKQMDIPINDANLSQYKAYINMENSVSEAFSKISDSLIDDVIKGLNVTDESAEQFGFEALKNPMFDALSNLTDSLSEVLSGNQKIDVSKDISALISDAKELNITLNNTETLLSSLDEGKGSVGDVLKAFVSDITSESSFVAANEVQTEENAENSGNINVSVEAKEALSVPEKEIGALIKNENTAVNDNPAENNIRDVLGDISRLFEKDSVKDLFNKVFSSNWSLDVDKLKDKAEVKHLYEKLFNDTRNLLNAINESAEKFTGAKEGINNLRENIEFINDLNHYVPYIQIPFHNDENSANSELYVFKNRKNLASSDGELSAFIHLDMSNLGPTDVLVKMRDMHITTNFTMKDEDTLIFIEHHLDYLDKRLNEKGYSFEASVSTKKDEISPITRMLAENERHLLFSDTSFDARV